jgi:hypothetical protein
MRASPSGFADPVSKKALDAAILGRADLLIAFLCKHSHLPGVRCNLKLAEAFGEECAIRGSASDALLLEMVSISADGAPGATSSEFLPVCAVYGLAKRGAKDLAFRDKALVALKEASDDLRFRVRDAVSQGLAILGAANPDDTVKRLAKWTDGFLYAANVVEALSVPAFLEGIRDGEETVRRLDECFQVAINAPRSAERYPGYKSLLEGLAKVPGLVAARFGAPVFDMLVSWTKAKEPMLREAILKTVQSARLKGRYAEDVRRVEEALIASEPKPRDPTMIVKHTRHRGSPRKR